MERKHDKEGILPYYSAQKAYRPGLKINRRKPNNNKNLEKYRTTIEKSYLENSYFQTESLAYIFKDATKIRN